jgi:hypothetical protein
LKLFIDPDDKPAKFTLYLRKPIFPTFDPPSEFSFMRPG